MSLEAWVTLLGWVLLHSLWQFALVGLGAALLMRAFPSHRAQHAVGILGLAVLALLPFLTLVHLWPAQGALTPAAALPAAPASVSLRGLEAAGPVPWPILVRAWVGGHLGWLVGLWATGVAAMGLRLIGGLIRLRGWRRTSEPVCELWAQRFQSLARRMGAPASAVLRGTRDLVTPVALGLRRPLVLMPLSLLVGLPEDLVEALLAHELAHLQRRDFLVNLLQSVLEVLCCHHPVVWWLSRRVRTLREHLADDLAARTLGDARRLALALDALDDVLRIQGGPLTPAMALSARGGTLSARIRHLIRPLPVAFHPLPALLAVLLMPCTALALKAGNPDQPPIPGNPALIQELDALAQREGVDPNLLRAVAWVESGLNRTARSPMGAVGALQVMPETAKRHGVTDLSDQAQVLAAGAKHLRYLLDRYQGDVSKALAAYNGGSQAVDSGKLSEETTAYVPLVMSVFQAKAVQPAKVLPWGGVDGVIRRESNQVWMCDSRILPGEGPSMEMEIREDRPGGKAICSVMIGQKVQADGSSAAPSPLPPAASSQAWINRPSVRFDAPEGTAVVIRCRAGKQVGETRLVLKDGWQTFAFTMQAQAH